MEKSFTFQSNMKTFDREDGEETYLKERECKRGRRNTTVSLGFSQGIAGRRIICSLKREITE